MSKEIVARKSNKIIISIYSAVGDLISAFSVQEKFFQIGWSFKEELIGIHSNGFINLFDLFGQQINTITLDQEIRDSKIVDCKIFKSVFGTGLAILTTSLSFFLYNNIYELKIRRLAEIPNLTSLPICWDVIAYDKDTKLIVSKEDKDLVILKSQDLSCLSINPFNDLFETVTLMSVSFDYSHIAFFTENGKLFLSKTDSNISTYISVFDTECKTNPKQLAWCTNEAIAGHWANFILFVDLKNNWLNYPTYSTIHMIQEIDCIRVIDCHCQEVITKVNDVSVEIFKIGSWSSGANLLEANRLFEMQNHRVDDYIRLIQDKNEMELAVNMCLEAAGHEFNVVTQKMLLRAASFGKCFAKSANSDYFVNICQKLRILNAIRKPNVGIPLTYFQLDVLSIDTLIERLIDRRLFLLALKMASYLKMSPEQGENKILTKWAFYKVRQQENNDEQTAINIYDKIRNHPGVSFAEIANKAIEYGRTNLAVYLVEHELKPTDQVPLLLKLKQYRASLTKAIESGDTNLVFMVILRLKKIQSASDFLMGIRACPVAYALYKKVIYFTVVVAFMFVLNIYFKTFQYCKQEDKEYFRNLYFQEDDSASEALCYLEQSIGTDHTELTKKKNKISLISSSLDTVKKSRNEFLITHTDEYLRLLRYQLKLEEKFPSTKFFNLSLQDTMKVLLQNRESKLCEEMKKEFKVPDKRYYHLKLITLAEINEWMEIEKLSKGKKSPIGYEVMVW